MRNDGLLERVISAPDGQTMLALYDDTGIERLEDYYGTDITHEYNDDELEEIEQELK